MKASSHRDHFADFFVARISSNAIASPETRNIKKFHQNINQHTFTSTLDDTVRVLYIKSVSYIHRKHRTRTPINFNKNNQQSMISESECQSTCSKAQGSRRLITLEASDGQKFALHLYETLPSKLIQDAIEDDIEEQSESDDENNTSDPTVIPLVNVRPNALENVVTFLKHHAIEPLQPIAPPLDGSSFEETIQQEWYRRFISDLPSKEDLFELLNAANYMDIGCLFNITCLRLSFLLYDKSPEEIRQILNLPELSKEEEAKAREDHPWMFED